jgi:hypothetical protein
MTNHFIVPSIAPLPSLVGHVKIKGNKEVLYANLRISLQHHRKTI